jgi:hypothetical protein
MIKINKSDSIVFYVLSDESNEIFHYGKVEVGQTLSSGLHSLETFQSKEKFEDRLRELDLYGEYIASISI